MELALAPEVAAMIEDRIRSGEFPTAEAVVTAALHALRESNVDNFAPGEMDALLAEGKRSGPGLEGDAVLTEFRQWRAEARRR